MAKSHDDGNAGLQTPEADDSGIAGAGTDKAEYKAKITMATIHASPERAKTEGKRVAVATFIGIATGIKEVVNPNDETQVFTALTGNFEATDLYKGTVYRSGILYLPGGMHEMVVSMIESLSEEIVDENGVVTYKPNKFDKNGTSVQFALAIDAEPANSKAGYQYIARSLLPNDVEKADPLAKLRAVTLKLAPPMKALAAAA